MLTSWKMHTKRGPASFSKDCAFAGCSSNTHKHSLKKCCNRKQWGRTHTNTHANNRVCVCAAPVLKWKIYSIMKRLPLLRWLPFEGGYFQRFHSVERFGKSAPHSWKRCHCLARENGGGLFVLGSSVGICACVTVKDTICCILSRGSFVLGPACTRKLKFVSKVQTYVDGGIGSDGVAQIRFQRESNTMERLSYGRVNIRTWGIEFYFLDY